MEGFHIHHVLLPKQSSFGNNNALETDLQNVLGSLDTREQDHLPLERKVVTWTDVHVTLKTISSML